MRGSVDGFKGQTFLDKCSKKGKTVTIVKDTTGKVFGGYTDIVFDGSSSWKCDGQKNSFLFAFLDNKIIKCKCINNYNEVFKGSPSYITIFGSSVLCINSDCNLNSNSLCNELGTYYE